MRGFSATMSTRITGTPQILSKAELTSMYKFSDHVDLLGEVAHIHPYCDFVLVSPRPELPLVMNTVDGIPFPLRLKNFWADDTRKGVDFLSGKQVYKHGISSGLTEGKITSSDLGVIIVNGLEVTPFSIPGDSGSNPWSFSL